MADITLTGTVNLSSFNSYWVQDYWIWDGTRNVDISVTLTVANGATLTIGSNRLLNIGGSLVNNGTIVTVAPYDDNEHNIHKSGGCVDIWPEATFANTGTITNNGDIYIRCEYSDLDDTVLQANVTGIGSITAKFIAIIHNEADLIAANSCASNIYNKIEIKGDSIIQLTGRDTLTIDKNIYIEPGSGLIVPYGKTLEFAGNHQIFNSGDISVYGVMTIGNGVWFFNKQNMEIGVPPVSSETANVTVSTGGNFVNDGNINLYATGTLDASSGEYHGNTPEGDGTYTEPEI